MKKLVLFSIVLLGPGFCYGMEQRDPSPNTTVLLYNAAKAESEDVIRNFESGKYADNLGLMKVNAQRAEAFLNSAKNAFEKNRATITDPAKSSEIEINLEVLGRRLKEIRAQLSASDLLTRLRVEKVRSEKGAGFENIKEDIV